MPRNLQREAIIKAAQQGTLNVAQAETPTRTFAEGEAWRCHACHQDTFGIYKEGKLNIKYRERGLSVQTARARIEARCRHCGQLNVLNLSTVETVIEQKKEPFATEAALALANEHGIDIDTVEGSGQNGRVVVGDVEEIVREKEAELQAKIVPRANSTQSAPPPGAMSEEPLEIDSE